MGLWVCHRSIILAGLCLIFVANTAQLAARLYRKQSYDGMAEQGDIWADYSRLMELQKLVNPHTGKLWLERHSATPVTKGCVVHVANYRTETDAYLEQCQLEQSDQYN